MACWATADDVYTARAASAVVTATERVMVCMGQIPTDATQGASGRAALDLGMSTTASARPTHPELRGAFEDLRAREFSRLDKHGYVYLDYTGSALYAESHLRGHERFLEENVLGNPHSENPASAAATKIVEGTRRDVLDFFGADQTSTPWSSPRTRPPR